MPGTIPPGEAVEASGLASLAAAGSELSATAAIFLDQARALGQRFLSEARETADGSLYWLKAAENAAGERTPLGPHLHAGFGGIALFLAALARSSGDPGYGDAALRALVPLRRQLRRMAGEQDQQLSLKLGAVTGLASLVYTLLRVGTWLGEPALVDDAAEAATLLDAQSVAGDSFHDLMYGSAGALLVLLLLDAELPEASRARVGPLARAIACGEHLLRRKTASPGAAPAGTAGWPSPIQPPGCGFAHGASGIALALSRLAHRSGRDDFRAAAREGLAFERLHYDPQIDNWIPVKGRPLRILLNGWCNGAAGIALARLELLALDPRDPELAGDLELALASVLRAGPADIDTICCGNLGRADILLEAARRLDRPDLLEAARRIALAAGQKARGAGFLTSFPERLTAGFHTGLPGIGYALLRLAGAPAMPCVQAVD